MVRLRTRYHRELWQRETDSRFKDTNIISTCHLKGATLRGKTGWPSPTSSILICPTLTSSAKSSFKRMLMSLLNSLRLLIRHRMALPIFKLRRTSSVSIETHSSPPFQIKTSSCQRNAHTLVAQLPSAQVSRCPRFRRLLSSLELKNTGRLRQLWKRPPK